MRNKIQVTFQKLFYNQNYRKIFGRTRPGHEGLSGTVKPIGGRNASNLP